MPSRAAAPSAEAVGDPRLQSYAAWNAGCLQATRGDTEAGINGVHAEPGAVSGSAQHRLRDRLAGPGLQGARGLRPGDRLPRAGDRVHARVRVPAAVVLVPGVVERGLPSAGRLERARELARDALAVAARRGSSWATGVAQRALGRIAHTAGDVRRRGPSPPGLADLRLDRAWFDVASTRLDLAERTRRRDGRTCRGASRRGPRHPRPPARPQVSGPGGAAGGGARRAHGRGNHHRNGRGRRPPARGWRRHLRPSERGADMPLECHRATRTETFREETHEVVRKARGHPQRSAPGQPESLTPEPEGRDARAPIREV